MSEIVYLNGKFVPYEEAVVPVEDRGNLFADGIYEVIRIYGGHPFVMKAHMERLERSAQEIRLPAVDIEALTHAGLETVRRNAIGDGSLYIQVSRGPAPRNHAFPPDPRPTVFMIARSLERPATSLREQGVACITVPDIRWLRCDIKSIALLPNVLAKQQAKEAGAFEALFVRDGIVTEGTSSNVFAVKGGQIVTHPDGEHILPGITRRLILAIAAQEGIDVVEETLRQEDLDGVDELFISGTNTEVMAVVTVDGRQVGDGRPGPVTRAIQEKYDELVQKVASGESIDDFI